MLVTAAKMRVEEKKHERKTGIWDADEKDRLGRKTRHGYMAFGGMADFTVQTLVSGGRRYGNEGEKAFEAGRDTSLALTMTAFDHF